MDNIYEELKNIFQNFRWIDDIPEDQFRRDEICLEARAALLIEANCTSERFPAFVRNAVKQFAEKNYAEYRDFCIIFPRSLLLEIKFHRLKRLNC